MLLKSSRNRGLVSALLLVAAACFLVAQTGCGGAEEGPPRYQLSGSVTYDGQPVPFGQIVFAPDTAAGNSGPQGVADVRDGKYDTSNAGKGTVGGPHVAKITGFGSDPASGTEDNPIPPLFSGYETKVDLPKEDGTHDFQVPAGGKPK